MHEWLEDWIDAYCASYFYYQSNKQQCTSIMIVNEHQNRCVIMRIGICVQKQCLEEIWYDEQQQQQLIN